VKISLNWLKDYVDLSGISSEEIVDKITYAGLEVEEVIDQAKNFANMIVGFVKERKKHPNANKLSLVIVTDGERDYNVVCGAPNVAEAQKIAFAKIGTIIPNGGFKIEKAKIRGEVSEGMICSERELGISDNHDGIMILDPSLKEGTDLAVALGLDDVTMEINITPNRADALSHIGVARDLSALYNRPLKYPEVKLSESGKKSEELASVEILDTDNCPRYVGKVISNVTIKESPEWLKKRIKSIGLRPINNVVDITNYILHEVGQPLHAFDLDNVAGKKIIVRKAAEGEKFVTLDSKERTLKSTNLMVCDAERSVAVAGVMGGENSEVTSSTKNVLIESAFFNPSSVRKTAKHLALSTDASYRFERGVDYKNSLWAAKRAAQLIQETAGGEVAVGEIDAYPNKIETKKTFVRFSRVERILGYAVPKESIINILTSLGFVITSQNEEKLEVEIPTYRSDIEREIDLIEEVARIYGYQIIPEISKISVALEVKVDQSAFKDNVKSNLNSLGFFEIITNSMLSENIASKFGKPVSVLNPQNSEMSRIRPSLMPGLLTSISNNLKVNERDLMFFEVGKVINQKNPKIISFDDFVEEEFLAAAVTGNITRTQWYEKDRTLDIYDLVGISKTFIEKTIVGAKCQFKPVLNHITNYDFAMQVIVESKVIGLIGKLDKQITSAFDINQPVFILEINLDEFRHITAQKKSFIDLLKFPKVFRDIAVVVSKEVEAGRVVEVIKESGSNLLHNVILFDIFQSESLGKGNKSLAFQLEYYNEARTLTEDEVEKDFRAVIKAVEEKLNAQLRGS
jgi:phenylalanyl-tRNA synthetase beta chain